MTPEERIDEAIDRVLRAGDMVSLKWYRRPKLDKMRQAMRDIMSESYIAGSNACHKIMTDGIPQPLSGEDARKLAEGMIAVLSAKGAKLEIPGLSDDEFTKSFNRAVKEVLS